ncbi:hypothetical protein [Alsobacter sp. R-9]
MDRKLEVLLLCDYRTDIAATVREHIDALCGMSRHHVRKLSILGDLPPNLELDCFDAIVVHYSLVACHNTYLSEASRQRLGQFAGLKAIFIQDEYRFVDASIDAMRQIGIHVLFTCVPTEEIHKVYSPERLPGVKMVNVLTGYVPEHLLGKSVPAYADRSIDVGYRARKVPAWLGDLGQEKYRIGLRFADDARGDGLALDVSYREEDRLYGDDWITFVTRCKAMLGVESGASVFDFTGRIQADVDGHVRRDPTVDYETLKSLYFAEEEGRIRLNQISPRCFESAALRTLMVMYEGDYSGRLVAWRHYVPLRKDHSNHAEVVAAIKDVERAELIIRQAYEEVACNPANTFRAFVAEFDAVLSEEFQPAMAASRAPLDDRTFAAVSNPSWRTRRRLVTRRLIENAHRFLYRDLLGGASPETRERVQWWIRKLIYPLQVVRRRLRA